MLSEAGISRAACLLTNVFNLYAPHGDDSFCGSRKEAINGYPDLSGSAFVRREFIPELERLGDEIALCNPNVIIALGNVAMWALCGKTAITKFRGVTCLSTHTAIGYKVLPTYNPAAITRQWSLRPTMVLDLQKAAREAEFPDLRRPQRNIYIPESVEDLYEFQSAHISPNTTLAVDIETSGKIITCIGFAPTPQASLVIPFLDVRRDGRTYWASREDEGLVWGFIRQLLGDRGVKKVFQNGLYDIAFLWRGYGIAVLGAEHDTMLLHHALQPEALKGLGFLGSVYTDEGAWKQDRGRHETIKRDS